MKLPKKIKILGRTWTIKKNTNMAEKGVTWEHYLIEINTDHCTVAEEVRDVLMHECLEALFIASGASYDSINGEEGIYVFDHDKFNTVLVPEIISITRQLDKYLKE